MRGEALHSIGRHNGSGGARTPCSRRARGMRRCRTRFDDVRNASSRVADMRKVVRMHPVRRCARPLEGRHTGAGVDGYLSERKGTQPAIRQQEPCRRLPFRTQPRQRSRRTVSQPVPATHPAAVSGTAPPRPETCDPRSVHRRRRSPGEPSSWRNVTVSRACSALLAVSRQHHETARNPSTT